MIQLPTLALPLHPMRLRREAGRISVFDPLRRKYVALTPEEHVRQQFVAWLIHHLGYPAALMNNEVALNLGGVRRRCDTLVFTRSGAHFMIVEYKAPDVAITQDTFDQIARYNMALHARYLAVSNGLAHYCCELDYNHDSYHFLTDVPNYPTK